MCLSIFCFNRATIVLDAEHDRIEAIEYNVGFINWKIKGKKMND